MQFLFDGRRPGCRRYFLLIIKHLGDGVLIKSEGHCTTNFKSLLFPTAKDAQVIYMYTRLLPGAVGGKSKTDPDLVAYSSVLFFYFFSEGVAAIFLFITSMPFCRMVSRLRRMSAIVGLHGTWG